MASSQLQQSLRSAQSQVGFTLLEVLIALAIIATALLATVGSANVHLQVQSQTQQLQIANWVIDNALTELRLRESYPEVGVREGDEVIAGVRYRWRAQIDNTELPDMRRGELSVRVLPKLAGDGQSSAPLTRRSAFFARR